MAKDNSRIFSPGNAENPASIVKARQIAQIELALQQRKAAEAAKALESQAEAVTQLQTG